MEIDTVLAAVSETLSCSIGMETEPGIACRMMLIHPRRTSSREAKAAVRVDVSQPKLI